MTRASILVPTHDRPQTLGLAVASALAQTVSELEVIIIGDGVTDAVRTEALRLLAGDSRIVFLDLPKGEHHGEAYRDAAIRASRSDAIFYLCDDDLLMPTHVAELLALLESGKTFVQCLGGWIDVGGEVRRYPGSLGSDDAIAGVLETRWDYNFISLTGTAHSRAFYLDVGRPWTPTPPGDWPDRYQWRKMLNQPGFVGATSTRMTALQFPATQPSRAGVTPAEQFDELSRWADLIREPGAQDRIDRQIIEATDAELGTYLRAFIAAQADLRLAAADHEELRRYRQDFGPLDPAG